MIDMMEIQYKEKEEESFDLKKDFIYACKIYNQNHLE
jgi:hypothetical protein